MDYDNVKWSGDSDTWPQFGEFLQNKFTKKGGEILLVHYMGSPIMIPAADSSGYVPETFIMTIIASKLVPAQLYIIESFWFPEFQEKLNRDQFSVMYQELLWTRFSLCQIRTVVTSALDPVFFFQV